MDVELIDAGTEFVETQEVTLKASNGNCLKLNPDDEYGYGEEYPVTPTIHCFLIHSFTLLLCQVLTKILQVPCVRAITMRDFIWSDLH